MLSQRKLNLPVIVNLEKPKDVLVFCFRAKSPRTLNPSSDNGLSVLG